MKINGYFRRVNWLYFVVGLILGVAFWRGIQVWDFPLDDPDTSWHYLVAAHIRTFGERPLGEIEYNLNSSSVWYYKPPLYFYLIAALGYIHQSIWFLGMVNFIAQIMCIYILFYLAKNMFGPFTGILAALLYVFSDFYLQQVNYIHPPYLMHVGFACTWFCLWNFWEKGKSKFAYLTVTMFIITLSLYLSDLVMLPALCLVLWKTTRKHHWQRNSFLNLLGYAIILFFPGWVISTLFRLEIWESVHNSGVPFISGISDFYAQVSRNLPFIVRSFLPFFPQPPLREWWYICSGALIVLTLYFSKKRSIFLLLFGIISSGLVILSLSHISVSSRYVIPFIFPVFLFLAGTVSELGIITRFKIISLAFLLLLVVLSGKFWLDPHSWFTFPQQQAFISANKQLLTYIERNAIPTGRIAFQRVYLPPSATPIIKNDLTFWDTIERIHKLPIVHFSVDAAAPTVPDNPEVIFLVCSGKPSPYTVPLVDCTSQYQTLNSRWAIRDQVYADKLFQIWSLFPRDTAMK